MSDFTPTPEQLAIVEAAVETQDNLLVSALAGAAKTSTLVLLAEALPTTQMLCLAFNKRIADEMRERLPRNCTSSTLNSLGHRAWASYLGKRLNVDARKTHRILTSLIEKLTGHEKSVAWERFSDLMRNIDFGKSCGWIPDGHYPRAKRLMTDDEFFAHLEEEPSHLEADLITAATIQSLDEAMRGTIDFSEQLLMPTCFPSIFEYYPLVLIDEAQDLSALNHAMLRKIAKKRLIAVGDACQSIYGFRGAHQDSMNVLKQGLSMREFQLTISFRCPILVVEEARVRAPAMQYPAWAKPGVVDRLTSWSIDTIPQDNVAVICRNNAPLFTMAIRLLRDGRYPELVGNDIGKALIKQLTKLGPTSMSQRDARLAVEEWRESKLAKSRSPERIHDRAECLLVFVNEGSTLGKAIDYAERVMSVAGPVKLMTGHKSKGLEFHSVFILDRDLLRLKEQQDRNLLYVMQTRAMESLTYVTSQGYTSKKDQEDE